MESYNDLVYNNEQLHRECLQLKEQNKRYVQDQDSILQVNAKLKTQIEDTYLELDISNKEKEYLKLSCLQLSKKIELLGNEIKNLNVDDQIQKIKDQDTQLTEPLQVAPKQDRPIIIDMNGQQGNTSHQKIVQGDTIQTPGQLQQKNEVHEGQSYEQALKTVQPIQSKDTIDPAHMKYSSSVTVENFKKYALIVDHQEIDIKKLIGQGSFAKAYLAIWRGVHVVVKQIDLNKGANIVNFAHEVQCMSRIRHPNVILLYGVVLDEGERLWLILEYMKQGTLKQWIYANKDIPLFYNQKDKIRLQLEKALQVAQGMLALHNNNPTIIHRDLKPSNIFLDQNGIAKVGDLGVAKIISNKNALCDLTGETGTYMYMAPEVIRREQYGTSADVYSWGITLIEIVSQETPYETQYLTPIQIALAVSDYTLTPTIPKQIKQFSEELTQMLLMCVDKDPVNRPTFQDIVIKLQNILENKHQNISKNSSNQKGGSVLLGGSIFGYKKT